MCYGNDKNEEFTFGDSVCAFIVILGFIKAVELGYLVVHHLRWV